jgi:hypothetical protein
MEGNGGSLRIAPNALDGPNRHICAFFNGMDEQYRVLGSFIKEGFDNGDKAVHLIDPERRTNHLRRLADAGIDVDDAIESGQLDIYLWEDSYLREGRFDQDIWLAFFEDVLKSGPAAGFAQTRVLGQMEWALIHLPGVEDLIEYETRLNQVVPKYDDTVLCAYDLSKFGAETVIYALRTHPLVIIGGLLHENPFYVEPDQLLDDLRQRRLSGELAELAH